VLNPVEPPWYVTRMPGGVTGTAREGLPMSIKGTYLETAQAVVMLADRRSQLVQGNESE